MDVLARAQSVERRAGLATFIAGLWVFAGPVVLDHTAAEDGFGEYRTAMVLASLIAVVGGVRASAPLRLPWLGLVTSGLAVFLVAAPMLSHWSNGSLVVQMNQVVVCFAIALGSVASAALRPSRVRQWK
ncbi:hypothetical protein [Lentzea sp. NPDC051838]|uniref:hypothetical protein n=1 Tax=Lentzea sp. NPDC051838 TaxID=3154849 RepID=UPI003448835C